MVENLSIQHYKVGTRYFLIAVNVFTSSRGTTRQSHRHDHNHDNQKYLSPFTVFSLVKER